VYSKLLSFDPSYKKTFKMNRHLFLVMFFADCHVFYSSAFIKICLLIYVDCNMTDKIMVSWEMTWKALSGNHDSSSQERFSAS
jgi:hypothetical protein